MSLTIDAGARREAIAVRFGEIGPSGIHLGQLAADIAVSELVSVGDIHRTVGRLKPRAFGHMGIVVGDIVETALDERNRHGEYGLSCIDGEGSRDATPEDVSSIAKLAGTWVDTLLLASRQVLNNPADDRRRANIGVLEGHWALRRIVEDLDCGLEGLMSGGIGTAVNQMFTTSFGMHEYWVRNDVNKLDLYPALRRSNGPIRSAAGLEVSQLHAYNVRYSGKRNDERHHLKRYYPNKIDSSIYYESGQGTITLREAIEDLPIRRHGTIGHVPLSVLGPRIGCPILLTPRLLQRLWEAYIDSLEEAQLL
jgi:hypothetical protein